MLFSIFVDVLLLSELEKFIDFINDAIITGIQSILVHIQSFSLAKKQVLENINSNKTFKLVFLLQASAMPLECNISSSAVEFIQL